MEKKKRLIINVIYYGMIISFIFLISFFVLKKCLIVILSYFTAVLLKPFINYLIRCLHLKNALFIRIMTVIIFLVLYVVFIFLLLLSSMLFLKAISFLPQYLEQIYVELMNHRYLIVLSNQFYRQIQTIIENMISICFDSLFSIAMNIVHFMFCFFIHVFLTCLFLLNQDVFKKINKYNYFVESINETCKMIIRTYVILFIVTFVILWIGFIMIHLDHALSIAFFIALFDFFPVLGIEMIMFPWIILLAVMNKIAFALKILILYVILALIRNILEPQLLSKQIKIPMLYMFITMYILTKLMGVLGMLIAPFVVMVVLDLKNNQRYLKIIKKSFEN